MATIQSEMSDLVSAKKQVLVRKLAAFLLAIPALILLLTAYVLATVALLRWLEGQFAEVPSLLILGAGYAVFACVVIAVAKWWARPQPVARSPHSQPNAATTAFAETAAEAVQHMTTKNLRTSLLLTLVAGFAYGALQQRDQD